MKGGGAKMETHITKYDTYLDALISVTKRLSTYENRFHMSSEAFFDKYRKGQMGDDLEFVEWSNDYQHYLDIRQSVEKKLQNVA
jgi:hypothetical protein